MNNIEAKRGMKILGIIVVVYGLLVATHEGEFWPFSIYPMFSQAGNPWTRAMVIDVTDVPDNEIWLVQSPGTKMGPPVAMRKIGVEQIDYSDFISTTKNWTASRKETLRLMFGPENIGNNRWIVAKVHGHMVGHDSVAVTIQPFLLVTADTILTNPNLNASHYYTGAE